MYSEEHFKAIRSYDIPGTPTPLFVEIEPFGARWARFGLSDADLHVLQAAVLAGPEAGVVVPGTNGLRKIRFTSPSSGRGKSGAYRVFYLNIVDHGVIALWAVIAKGEAGNLTKAERQILAARVAAFRKFLEMRDRR